MKYISVRLILLCPGNRLVDSDMFDPILIILQIISMQCGYYFLKGSIFVAADTVFDVNLSLDHLFTGQYIQLTAFSGVLESCVNFLSAAAGYAQCLYAIFIPSHY